MRAVCVHRGPPDVSLPTDWAQALRHYKLIVISISLQSFVHGKNLCLEMPNSTFPQRRVSGLAVYRSQDQPGPLLPPATPQSQETLQGVPAHSVSPEAPVASLGVCYRGVSL